MIAHSEWKQGEIYEGAASNGNVIVFDADSKHIHGPSPDGSRPHGALLVHLCRCSKHSAEEAAVAYGPARNRHGNPGSRATAHLYPYHALPTR